MKTLRINKDYRVTIVHITEDSEEVIMTFQVDHLTPELALDEVKRVLLQECEYRVDEL